MYLLGHIDLRGALTKSQIFEMSRGRVGPLHEHAS
jgi:hypothetical protein